MSCKRNSQFNRLDRETTQEPKAFLQRKKDAVNVPAEAKSKLVAPILPGGVRGRVKRRNNNSLCLKGW